MLSAAYDELLVLFRVLSRDRSSWPREKSSLLFARSCQLHRLVQSPQNLSFRHLYRDKSIIFSYLFIFEVNRKHTQGARAQARGNSLSTPIPPRCAWICTYSKTTVYAKLVGGSGGGREGSQVYYGELENREWLVLPM